MLPVFCKNFLRRALLCDHSMRSTAHAVFERCSKYKSINCMTICTSCASQAQTYPTPLVRLIVGRGGSGRRVRPLTARPMR
jgi:hypothetical protein